jgi:CDP-diacylglycerol--glycerol-3-phosphate 3-phosphatidyltransferase
MEDIINEQKPVLSDRFRIIFKGIIDPIARFLNRIGLKPNTVTFLGLLGHVAAAFLLSKGWITWGGLLILLTAPIDVLDGAMARQRGEPTRFGGFVDSVTDRFAEFFIFGGLLLHYVQQQNSLAASLVYISIAGSIMVSYVRARAESLGFEAKIGILSRFERYVVLVPALIFNFPMIALWILAVLTNFTAIQRIISVRKQAYQKLDQSSDVKTV